MVGALVIRSSGFVRTTVALVMRTVIGSALRWIRAVVAVAGFIILRAIVVTSSSGSVYVT